jgi:hypothetical protein
MPTFARARQPRRACEGRSRWRRRGFAAAAHLCTGNGRFETVSGRVISRMDANSARWSLPMVALLGQLLSPSGRVSIHTGDKGYIFRVIRSPTSTRPQTTSRGPTTVRSGDMDQPNSPTPWHHHGTHTWWRPPPPRPLVRRRKRLGQLPREVPEVLSGSRRAGRHRRALAAAAAPSPERTRQRASGPRESDAASSLSGLFARPIGGAEHPRRSDPEEGQTAALPDACPSPHSPKWVS